MDLQEGMCVLAIIKALNQNLERGYANLQPQASLTTLLCLESTQCSKIEPGKSGRAGSVTLSSQYNHSSPCPYIIGALNQNYEMQTINLHDINGQARKVILAQKKTPPQYSQTKE